MTFLLNLTLSCFFSQNFLMKIIHRIIFVSIKKEKMQRKESSKVQARKREGGQRQTKPTWHGQIGKPTWHGQIGRFGKVERIGFIAV